MAARREGPRRAALPLVSTAAAARPPRPARQSPRAGPRRRPKYRRPAVAIELVAEDGASSSSPLFVFGLGFLIERLGADGLGAIPVALIASFPRVAALTDDLTRVTAAMAAIPGLAVYRSVDGSPWVHRLQPIEWGGW